MGEKWMLSGGAVNLCDLHETSSVTLLKEFPKEFRGICDDSSHACSWHLIRNVFAETLGRRLQSCFESELCGMTQTWSVANVRFRFKTHKLLVSGCGTKSQTGFSVDSPNIYAALPRNTHMLFVLDLRDFRMGLWGKRNHSGGVCASSDSSRGNEPNHIGSDVIKRFN